MGRGYILSLFFSNDAEYAWIAACILAFIMCLIARPLSRRIYLTLVLIGLILALRINIFFLAQEYHTPNPSRDVQYGLYFLESLFPFCWGAVFS